LEGVDCVPVVLDGTLEVGFLWGLRGMVVSGMVGSRVSWYIVRSVRIYFSQDHMLVGWLGLWGPVGPVGSKNPIGAARTFFKN